MPAARTCQPGERPRHHEDLFWPLLVLIQARPGHPGAKSTASARRAVRSGPERHSRRTAATTSNIASNLLLRCCPVTVQFGVEPRPPHLAALLQGLRNQCVFARKVLVDRALGNTGSLGWASTLTAGGTGSHRAAAHPSGVAPPRQARAGSSLARAVLPDSVIEQHPPASTGERPIARLVKARPVRSDRPPSPQSQEALQMLPASGIVCTVHRLPVLCQERLMLAIRQDAEDTLRVERILLLGVDGQQLGRDYAIAVIGVITELNREVAGRVSPAQLAAADAVLRAALFDDSTRQRASRVPPPPGPPSATIG